MADTLNQEVPGLHILTQRICRESEFNFLGMKVRKFTGWRKAYAMNSDGTFYLDADEYPQIILPTVEENYDEGTGAGKFFFIADLNPFQFSLPDTAQAEANVIGEEDGDF